MSTIPNFFIVGAARSGTTSLHRYLNQHPEIFITHRKEVHFFAADHFPRTGPGDGWLNKRVIRDEEEYKQLFFDARGAKAIGEASVFYLCFPDSAERIAQARPDAKIVIILREPVQRAYSSYMLLVRDGRETLGFAEGLKLESERKTKGFEPIWWYKELSLYYKQVKRYLDTFGTERVKVLLYDELCAKPELLLREVFAFLGVKEDVVIDTSVRYNAAGVPKSRELYTMLSRFIENSSVLVKGVKSLVPLRIRDAYAHRILDVLVRPTPIDAQVQSQLKAYFAEDVEKLEALLHRDLRRWQYREFSIAQTKTIRETAEGRK